MISVEEAQSKISKEISRLNAINIPLDEALGFVLAKDIPAPINLPPFRQSAMDGYAIRSEDLDRFKDLKVVEEIQAGRNSSPIVNQGEAVRIFTGAPVPDECDMVIMQEKAISNKGYVSFNDIYKKPGLNIRSIGEQISKNELATSENHLINERSIGLLASLGLSEINVIRKPTIGLLITGDELQEQGKNLEYGQIYESNGSTLKAVLRQFGFDVQKQYKAVDDLNETEEIVRAALKDCDVVLTSGGISVGKYDFIKEAVSRNGLNEIFYKISQKPGKPMLFAKDDGKHLFALPGNPASLLVCFYFYVLPALRIMSGHPEPFLVKKSAQLTHTFSKKGPRSQFLKATLSENRVSLQAVQSSFDLYSFAHSNAIAYLPEGDKSYAQGDVLTVFQLP